MAQSPRPVDLRLTIPAGAPYHVVAGELAGKFAEYSGLDAEAAGRFATQIEELTATLGAGAPDESIALEMQARERELTVTATAGTRREQATQRLPA